MHFLFGALLLKGELFVHIGVSGARALAGFAVGSLIGFGLGVANGLSVVSRKFTDTTHQAIRKVPHLALVPLVIIWFGNRDCREDRYLTQNPNKRTRSATKRSSPIANDTTSASGTSADFGERADVVNRFPTVSHPETLTRRASPVGRSH